MATFEHCHRCKPPQRHVGCHSDCPYYAQEVQRLDAEKAARKAYLSGHDDYLTARSFKQRRLKNLK